MLLSMYESQIIIIVCLQYLYTVDFKIKGTEFVREFKFKNGHSVPMFDILSMHGLNQIIGYAKFNNKDTANVYYR